MPEGKTTMYKCSMKISEGVAALLANAHQTAPSGKKYYFEGDLNQMSQAFSVATKLGCKAEIDGGLPFVRSKEDFDRVVKYIVDNKVEGYWHYNQ